MKSESPFFLQLEAKKLYEYGKQKKYGQKMCRCLYNCCVVSLNLKMFQLEVLSYLISKTEIKKLKL